jgi:hypothetical protein
MAPRSQPEYHAALFRGPAIMSKARKLLTQAEWEGGESAARGRGRSTNPYPHSDIAARNGWFAGYDRAVEEMSRRGREPRFKGY